MFNPNELLPGNHVNAGAADAAERQALPECTLSRLISFTHISSISAG